MLSIAFNPGFAFLLAMPVCVLLPRAYRPAIMALAACIALALLLVPPFGGHGSFAQIGLEVVPLRLDSLAQIFGVAFIFAAAIVGLSTHARVHPLEDGAILAMAGGATSALFAGDLVSFVAGVETAGLAGAWIIFSSTSKNALAAGGRYLLWQWLGGIFLLSGVAFHLADGFGSSFEQLPTDSAGGALFLIGLCVKIGAPFAHLWLKDSAPVATPHGAAALSAFGAPLAAYALARGYTGEPLLIGGGLTMAIVFGLWAIAEDDARRALTRSNAAQLGLSVCAIGLGSAIGLAAGAAHVFTTIIAFALMQLGIGAVADVYGGARLSRVRGAVQGLPLASGLYMVGAASAAGAPGLAGFMSFVALHAAAAQGPFGMQAAVVALCALTAALTLVRIPFPMLFAREEASAPRAQPEDGARLGMAMAAFFCVAIGMAPGWLYGMAPPAPLTLNAYAPAHVVRQAEIVLIAFAVYGLFSAFKATGFRRPFDLLDLDHLYAGPAARLAHVSGGAILRAFEFVSRGAGALAAWLGRRLLVLAEAQDRPHAFTAWSAAGAQIGVIILATLAYLIARN